MTRKTIMDTQDQGGKEKPMRMIKGKTWIGIEYCVKARTMWLGYVFVVCVSIALVMHQFVTHKPQRLSVLCMICIAVVLIGLYYRRLSEKNGYEEKGDENQRSGDS